MCGYDRKATRSQEAAAKYLLMGGFASAFLLYGMALTYGATGTTLLSQIAHDAVGTHGHLNTLLLAGLILMGIGLAFKASAAPFHMWTPDVYQGAPVPVTAFMSVATKAAAFAMLLRIFVQGLPGLQPQWAAMLAVIAAFSIVVGNLVALMQTDLKRLLAYSGIAQAGYVLIGVLGAVRSDVGAVLFYLVVYLFMNFGAFAVLVGLSGPNGERPNLRDLNGLGYRRPALGLALTLCMLSLAGFPPTVGFAGKFFLFAAGVQAGYTWLVILAVVFSVISVAYYLRVIVHIYSPVAAPDATGPTWSQHVVVIVSGVLSLGVGIYPSLLLLLSTASANRVIGSP